MSTLAEYEQIRSATKREIFESASRSPDPRIRELAAENKYAPPDILARLSTDEYMWVQLAVLSNKNTPATVLDKMTRNHDHIFLTEAASDNRALPYVLARLAASSVRNVRCNVARNQNTTSDILDRLADDNDWSVAAFVLYNENTSKETKFKIFLEHPEWVE